MIYKPFSTIKSEYPKIVGNEAIGTTEGQQIRYNYEVSEIGRKGNILHARDRDVKMLSRNEKPFVLHLDSVLGSEECDGLISLSRSRLQPSRVEDTGSGEERAGSGRTSRSMAFRIRENELVERIEMRIADLTGYPAENGEGLQILNYGLGEEYKPHFDFFPPHMVDAGKGGQRVGTFLIYLNDVAEGGETVFSKAGFSIVPKKGSAIYFHYANEHGQLDRLSVHSSVPVKKGEKWAATKWIRESNIYKCY
ncbi:2OG-Fe(II) oxygenase [Cytobacillus firmus]|uniref:Putative peptidyl prolyl 4-hydroxylase, alpha subunit n=1 Tax=Cytobacillus firmus TaxID=1399 RepID=A0A800MSN9_CYTFI|nr:2OG-Fe(II) oxygenase [Cytobacillus firmus]KAF0821758.1 putative peptidyl prolyl 4-hydroxylase, alpha subunit [Cytobacillus firmus]